jgi:hypothetical protein
MVPFTGQNFGRSLSSVSVPYRSVNRATPDLDQQLVVSGAGVGTSRATCGVEDDMDLRQSGIEVNAEHNKSCVRTTPAAKPSASPQRFRDRTRLWPACIERVATFSFAFALPPRATPLYRYLLVPGNAASSSSHSGELLGLCRNAKNKQRPGLGKPGPLTPARESLVHLVG